MPFLAQPAAVLFLALGAGLPLPRPVPAQVRRADLAGHQWKMTYGGTPCLINLRPDGAYEHSAGGEYLFRGTWELEGGEFRLTETADGGRTWDWYRCVLVPDPGAWGKARASAGMLTRQPFYFQEEGWERPPVKFALSSPGPLPPPPPPPAPREY